MRDQRSKKENSSMTKLIVLSDCLSSNHSFWIRIGHLEPLSSMIEILIVDSGEIIDSLDREDIIIIYKASRRGYKNSLDKKSRGVKIISDIDDYLWMTGITGWGRERLKLHKSLKKM